MMTSVKLVPFAVSLAVEDFAGILNYEALRE